MTYLDVLQLLGGLALFLYGMHVMSDGLEKSAGGQLERTLEKMTNNTVKGVLLGAGITAVIQSSSATTVMLVGFVNSGIMKLSQAIGVIMGANIGTTMTAWILSLNGIEGDSVMMQMLKPANFAPILGMIGVVLTVFISNFKRKDIGYILIGFAVLMLGMDSMSEVAAGLKDEPLFEQMISYCTNPVLGILVGTVMTTILQSSSASVGILQALSVTGSITFGSAIPIILGQNIGTCTTALISCIGANKSAKRVAFVHLYFNIIGTLLFCGVFYTLNNFIEFAFLDDALNSTNIALVHTVFNVATTLVLLPFNKLLGKLAEWTVRDKAEKKSTTEEEHEIFIDDRFLNTPSFAIEQCKKLTVRMGELARDTLLGAIDCVQNYSAETARTVNENEEAIDRYEDTIGTYLVKLSSRSLSMDDSRDVSKLLHIIGDFERISDHATNIVQVAEEIHQKNVQFSDAAKAEIKTMIDAVSEIMGLAIDAFEFDEIAIAERVEPLEEIIDVLNNEIRSRHINRLQSGNCTIELGFILSDLLTNLERVSDHCSNIAVCMIEIAKSSLDTHEYIVALHAEPKQQYVDDYDRFKKKYALPAVTVESGVEMVAAQQ